MTNPLDLPAADEIVLRYLELRDYVQAEDKTHQARMAQYVAGMQALAAAADLLMKKTGQKALSTAHGTAYYSHTLSAKCENPDEFFEFVFNMASYDRVAAKAFLTTHVGKEAVQAHMDGPGVGHPPPGVKTEQVIKVNFRRT